MWCCWIFPGRNAASIQRRGRRDPLGWLRESWETSTRCSREATYSNGTGPDPADGIHAAEPPQASTACYKDKNGQSVFVAAFGSPTSGVSAIRDLQLRARFGR
jgi:hypothetical protein